MRWRLPPNPPVRPVPPAPGPGPVVLVLPARDEAATVATVVRRAPHEVAGRRVQVVVVDDGSTDATACAAVAAGATVVAHAHARGLGAAVRTGFAAALAQGAAVVAFCDADGEYAPEELAAVAAPILEGRADYVVGSRFAGRIHRMLRRRRFGNRVLTALLRWTSRMSRSRLTDGQSGYRALSRDAAQAATIEHDFNYAQVLTLDLLGQGYRYVEVPISYRFRESGRSFVRLVPYVRAVLPAMWRVVQRAPGPVGDPATADRLRRTARTGIAALAIAFALLTVVRAWPDARAAWSDAQPLGLVAGFVLAVLGMALLASPWRAVARAIGAPPLTTGRWLGAYFTGEIAKYVPGGIWPVVGRAEQARRSGVPAAAAYASVPLSLGYAYLAAGVVLAVATVPAVAAGGRPESAAWTLLVVPLGLVALHPAVLGRLLRGAERLLRRPLGLTTPSWSRSVALTARYVPAWCCIGAATVLIARSLSPDVQPAGVFAAAIASWLAGFLFLPAPGGLGVREATFAAVAPLGFGTGIAIAATARLGFVLVDLVAFLFAAGLHRRASAAPAGSVLDDVRSESLAGLAPSHAIERPVDA